MPRPSSFPQMKPLNKPREKTPVVSQAAPFSDAEDGLVQSMKQRGSRSTRH